MNFNELITEITYGVNYDIGSVTQILAILFVTLAASFYEFVVYRLVSKRNYYNRSMHISLMVIPFFIAAIVAALQSNAVITLGTIGALAIIRYRSAIKDPIDMVYILWSVFIGITCGCKLYKLCLLTSIMVTLVLIAIELLGGKLLSNPFILVINCDDMNSDKEKEINNIIKKYSRKSRLKSRSYSNKGCDYVYEICTKKSQELAQELKENTNIKQLSLLEYDSDDVI